LNYYEYHFLYYFSPIVKRKFTPYHPESPGLQIGDEDHIKLKDEEGAPSFSGDIRGLQVLPAMLMVNSPSNHQEEG